MSYDLIYLNINKGFASNGFTYFFNYGVLGSYLPALAIILKIEKINYERLFKLIYYLSIPVAISLFFAIYTQYGFTTDLIYYRFGLGFEANVISPILISQYGGLILFTGIYRSFFILKKISVLNVIFTTSGLILLILGASRGPLLSTFLIITFVSMRKFFLNMYKATYWLKSILLFLILGITFLFSHYSLSSISIFSRTNETISNGRGLETRTKAWLSAWEQFKSNPIIGDKIIETAYNFYPHNLVLEILMATGIIGFTTFLLLLIQPLINFYTVNSITKLYFIYLFTYYLLCSCFSYSIVTNPQVWITLILASGLNKSFLLNINRCHNY